MAARLPNLAAPSPLGALLQPSLTDPMLVNGEINLNALKERMRNQIQEATQENGENIAPNWSNFFECTNACNVLFDLNKIWEDAGDEAELKNLTSKRYSKLTDPETKDWTLESACQQHQHFHLDGVFSKLFREIFVCILYARNCTAIRG